MYCSCHCTTNCLLKFIYKHNTMQTKIKLIITKQVEHVVLDFTRQITVSKKRNSLAFAIFYAGCLHYPLLNHYIISVEGFGFLRDPRGYVVFCFYPHGKVVLGEGQTKSGSKAPISRRSREQFTLAGIGLL